MAPHNLAMLRQACEAAGVQLGAYDSSIMAWLAGWEPQTCAVIAALLSRALAAGRARPPGSVLLTAAVAATARQALADASAWRSWRAEGAGCEACRRLDPVRCAGHTADEAQAASYDSVLRRLGGQDAAETPGECASGHEATLAPGRDGTAR
jgi:hypothetical protein